MHRETEI